MVIEQKLVKHYILKPFYTGIDFLMHNLG